MTKKWNTKNRNATATLKSHVNLGRIAVVPIRFKWNTDLLIC
jgi:hypothetical protein